MTTAFGTTSLGRNWLDRKDPSPEPKAEIPKGLSLEKLQAGGAVRNRTDNGKIVLCITPAQFADLPNGTPLRSLYEMPGSSVIQKKGASAISMDTRAGVMAYGFEVPDTIQAEVVERVSDMANMTAEQAKNWKLTA